MEPVTVADVLEALGQLAPSTVVVGPKGRPIALELDASPTDALVLTISEEGAGEGQA